MAQGVNPTVPELVLQICGISEFLAKPSSMITVHMTIDVMDHKKPSKPMQFLTFWQNLGNRFLISELVGFTSRTILGLG